MNYLQSKLFQVSDFILDNGNVGSTLFLHNQNSSSSEIISMPRQSIKSGSFTFNNNKNSAKFLREQRVTALSNELSEFIENHLS